MLQKNTPVPLDKNDPWARDVLERKAVADYLTPVIASISEPHVISLHSGYGTGKTFFVECWQQDLENKGFKTAYFNAWETDFSQDALSAFISSLKKIFPENKKMEAKLIDLAKKTGGFLRSKALPLLAKSLIKKTMGDEGLKEISDALSLDEEDIGDFLSSTAVEALSAQEAAEDSMKSFREYLATLIVDITNQDNLQENKEGLWEKKEDREKLIIFIDELDRCRPNYAVEILECIKHFFSVEGIVFVLSIDDEQLKNAIASVYGSKMDGEGYLRRFIDWQFVMPLPSPVNYARFLAEKFSLKDISNFSKNVSDYSVSDMVNAFGLFAGRFKLSLREQEQCFSNMSLVCRSLDKNDVPFAMALGIFVIIEFKWPRRIMEVQGDLEKIQNFIDEVYESLDEIYSASIKPNFDIDKALFYTWFLNDPLYKKLDVEAENLRKVCNDLAVDSSKKALKERQKNEKRVRTLDRALKYWSDIGWNYNLLEFSISSILVQRISGANKYNKR